MSLGFKNFLSASVCVEIALREESQTCKKKRVGEENNNMAF